MEPASDSWEARRLRRLLALLPVLLPALLPGLLPPFDPERKEQTTPFDPERKEKTTPFDPERKEKTTPFGVNLMRSQLLYRAAQSLLIPPQTWRQLHLAWGWLTII